MTAYTTAAIREKYDGFARQYEHRARLQTRMGVPRLRQALLAHAAGRVLEVAAGTGANFPYYPRACAITAVDLSPGMLAVARERAQQLGRPVTLRVMDAEALAFADQTFDTVVSTLSLCTFPRPEAALREMARVCRSEGHILLLEHGRSRTRLLAWLQDRLAERHARRLACQWNREPLALVQRAGLDLITARPSFFGIMHLLVARPDSPDV